MAVFLAMALKSVMAGAGFAPWSVALTAAALPVILVGLAVRLREDAGHVMLAAAAILAAGLFTPALFLEYREWAESMIVAAMLSAFWLLMLAGYRCVASGRAVFFGAVVLAAGLNLAVYT